MNRSSHCLRLFALAGLAVFGFFTFGVLRGERSELARPTPHAAATSYRVENAKLDNPTVEPGRVTWHPSFADARAASAKSGKPVLVFHMMGQLDKQFC
jgi:hypothetical protein